MTDDIEVLTLALARAVDAARAGIAEPVWTPLEVMLPASWLGGWMFMGASDAYLMPDGLVTYVGTEPPSRRIDWQGKPWERKVVFLYKHGITRRYLNIGEDLRCYVYRGDLCPIGEPVYQPIRTERAIDFAYEDIEAFGATHDTAYDEDFIAARNARLVAAGYRVIG